MNPNKNFLVTGDERHRIDFGDGSWVEIRPYVTVGERQSWSKAATKTRTTFRFSGRGKRSKSEGESEVDFDAEIFTRAMMNAIVVAWSDESPVTPENIARIPEPMVERIKEEFDRLNPQDEEEDEELGESVTASGPTSDQAAATSPTSLPF